MTTSINQEKLKKNVKQISYQKIFVPRSCRRSELYTYNLVTPDTPVTPDIHSEFFAVFNAKTSVCAIFLTSLMAFSVHLDPNSYVPSLNVDSFYVSTYKTIQFAL